ncbi:MAG: response regulator transcription factor [Pseudomonadota bacterium]
MQQITVVVIEDDALTQAALCLAIEADPRLSLLASFADLAGALAWLREHTADVVLTDLALPDGSGLDVILACALRHPDCDTLVLTMSGYEASVLACIEAGATGYLLKHEGPASVVRAIVDVRAGGAPMSPSIARMVTALIRKAREPAAAAIVPPVNLTRRESELLALIARGDSYAGIACGLNISVGTVQSHIKNIYEKLSVHSRSEAVFVAQRHGLLAAR